MNDNDIIWDDQVQDNGSVLWDDAPNANKLRGMTRKERALTQLVLAPEDVWAGALKSRGIDPASRHQFDIASVPANVARVGGLTAGSILGAPGGFGGRAVGAGAGKLGVDYLLRKAAEGYAGSEDDTVGLKEVLGKTNPVDYGIKSFLEGPAQETAGAAFNVGAKAIPAIGKAAMTKLEPTVVGRTAKAIGKASKAVVERIKGIPSIIDDFSMENIAQFTNREREFIEGTGSWAGKRVDAAGRNIAGWKSTMHQYDNEVLKRGSKRYGKDIANLSVRERSRILNRPDEYYEIVADKVNSNIIKPIEQTRAHLGKEVSSLKKASGLFAKGAKINLSPASSTFRDDAMGILDEFSPNLNSKQVRSVKNMIDDIAGLKRTAGTRTARSTTSGTVQGHYGPVDFTSVDDKLKGLAEELTKGYKNIGPQNINTVQAAVALKSKLRKLVTDDIYNRYPEWGAAAKNYSTFMDKLDRFEALVGKDDQAIMSAVLTKLIDDNNMSNVYAKRAVDELFSDIGLGQSNIDSLMSAVVNARARSGEVLTAGVKSMAPVAVGSTVAGPAGRAAGVGYVLTRITRNMARRSKELGETVGSAMSGVTDKTAQVASDLTKTYGPAVGHYGSKVYAALNSRGILDTIAERFGQEPTEEDLKILKSSKTKAMK